MRHDDALVRRRRLARRGHVHRLRRRIRRIEVQEPRNVVPQDRRLGVVRVRPCLGVRPQQARGVVCAAEVLVSDEFKGECGLVASFGLHLKSEVSVWRVHERRGGCTKALGTRGRASWGGEWSMNGSVWPVAYLCETVTVPSSFFHRMIIWLPAILCPKPLETIL